MGYTTEFRGSFKLSSPASPQQRDYLNLFSRTRRMKRSVAKLKKLYKGLHGFQGKYGKEGEYFCRDDGNFGQSEDESVIDFNRPPRTQPGLWCQWILSEDGGSLIWDGGEKFYYFVKWLQYLITNFFVPWGITLNGKVEFQGEDPKDWGWIIVKNNEVSEVNC